MVLLYSYCTPRFQVYQGRQKQIESRTAIGRAVGGRDTVQSVGIFSDLILSTESVERKF